MTELELAVIALSSDEQYRLYEDAEQYWNTGETGESLLRSFTEKHLRTAYPMNLVMVCATVYKVYANRYHTPWRLPHHAPWEVL